MYLYSNTDNQEQSPRRGTLPFTAERASSTDVEEPGISHQNEETLRQNAMPFDAKLTSTSTSLGADTQQTSITSGEESVSDGTSQSRGRKRRNRKRKPTRRKRNRSKNRPTSISSNRSNSKGSQTSSRRSTYPQDNYG